MPQWRIKALRAINILDNMLIFLTFILSHQAAVIPSIRRMKLVGLPDWYNDRSFGLDFLPKHHSAGGELGWQVILVSLAEKSSA